MDGYEATRQIRQFNTDVVITAQTAFALAGEREKKLWKQDVMIIFQSH